MDSSFVEENIQYQMPAYFMQYLSFAMKSRIFGAGFWIAEFDRKYIDIKNAIIDKNSYIQTPHYLEPYYLLTKTICVNDFN